MREIKFRAWHKKHNNMHIVRTIRFDGSNVTINNVSLEGYPAGIVGCGDIELMQYTGINARNGVEIYDGDILRGYHAFVAEAPIYQVYWNEGGFVVRNDKGMRYNIGDVECDDTEIIGNIYANPELLKEIP